MSTHGVTTGNGSSQMLLKRLRRVEDLIEPAALRPHEDIEHVHKLRVATRRAQAALDLHRADLPAKLRKESKRLLRSVRRAAGDARDADVHTLAFEALPEPENAEERAAVAYALDRLREEREEAQGSLAELHGAGVAGAIKQARREAKGVASTTPGEIVPDGRATLAALEDAARADLSDIENIHTVRKRAKGLRYALEMIGGETPDESVSAVLSELRGMQDVLGALNDQSSIVDRLRRYYGELERGLRENAPAERGLRSLLSRFENDLERLADTARATWGGPEGAKLIERAHAALSPDENEQHDGPMAPAASALRVRAGSDPNRLAAIDLGTNSIRLIIAELTDDGSYRVLDDEKEITRLGAGLAQTGRMSESAMERSVQAVKRMREIADGFGAGVVRAVGTAVARDASNAPELRDAILRTTGVELEIISPEREAQLAYRSVASAFDLSETSAAIVDIGGGSTEVVLCSRGLIEAVYPIPMGAVRLTEMFGGPEECSGPRWSEMRDAIRAEIKRVVGKPPFAPQMMIGTGGTLTTLAGVTLHQQRGPLWAQEGGSGVRGLEIQRSEFRHLLERLRKMPVSDRAKVPGLPAERADIIVAGVAIADLLMKRLGVNELRVHDRGIRDGLLLEMAEQARGGTAESGSTDAMRSVQRFARACRYDHTHCEHVAGLALQIFDQLRVPDSRLTSVQRAALTDESRLLLEAAALLQDVGYHINYTRHHKHSHHLILHADLPGFTPRQTRMIANIARYHRRAVPKLRHESFARLDAEDRDVVRALAGILRVAGGLDRTHVQRVTSVRVAIDEDRARFAAEAPDDPHVELWGASRKSDLFEQYFGLDVTFEWAPPSPDVATQGNPIA